MEYDQVQGSVVIQKSLNARNRPYVVQMENLIFFPTSGEKGLSSTTDNGDCKSVVFTDILFISPVGDVCETITVPPETGQTESAQSVLRCFFGGPESVPSISKQTWYCHTFSSMCSLMISRPLGGSKIE